MFMDQQYSERMGRHLAKLRQDKGLTQEQLAARLQVQGCDLTRSAGCKPSLPITSAKCSDCFWPATPIRK